MAGRRFEVRSPDGKGAKVPVAIPAGMLAAMSRSRSELAENSEWEVVAVPGEAAEAREGHDPSLGGIGQQRDPTGRRRDSVDELDIEDLVL